MTKILCQNCNIKILESDDFCYNCGKKIGDMKIERLELEYQVMKSTFAEQMLKGLEVSIVGFNIAIPVFVMVGLSAISILYYIFVES